MQRIQKKNKTISTKNNKIERLTLPKLQNVTRELKQSGECGTGIRMDR